MVKYGAVASTTRVSCIFLNKSDTSNKTCSVRYGQCDEKFDDFAHEQETSSNDTIHVDLMLHEITEQYCYIVTASNDTVTFIVEGRIVGEQQNLLYIDQCIAINKLIGSGSGNNTSSIVLGVVIPVFILLILVLLSIIIFIVAHSRTRGNTVVCSHFYGSPC